MKNIQYEAIVREYNDALRDDNRDLAERIWRANRDILTDEFGVFAPERIIPNPPVPKVRVESPVLAREDWKVKTAGLGQLEDTLNELAKDGYHPFSIIPQKGAYGIAHYVIVAADVKL